MTNVMRRPTTQSAWVASTLLAAVAGFAPGCGSESNDGATPANAAAGRPVLNAPTLAAVESVFDQYQAALLAADGDAAAALVTQSTLDDFEKQRMRALTASRETLEARTLIDQMTTLMMRQRIPAEELRSLDGRGLFALAVDEGWIGRESVEDAEIVVTERRGRVVFAAPVVNGTQGPPLFRFVETPEGWRLNLIALMQASRPLFNTLQAESGLDREAFLDAMVEAVTGIRVTDAHWEPPGA